MNKKYVIACFLLVISINIFSQDYKNPKLPINKRITDLLSKMTVEEKVAQLRSLFAANPKINDALLNNPKIMDSLFGKGISMINPDFENTLEATINNRNKVQEYLRTKTRLGIPAIFLDEAHHGLLAMQADVFPTSIAYACSWDTQLVEKIYNYVAAQASSRGTNMVLAPVIDVTRDPRWGRTSETFGEDPFFCGVMGSAVVRGFQGSSNGSIAPNHVAATLKHFTGHGQSEGGDNQAPADFPERVLRTFHMEPFRLAINRVQPAGIMPAYIEIDGVPCHANKWLLKDVLRKEWNYKGVLVSDWWAIDQLYKKHLVAANIKDAALMAFNAGVTVDLPYGNNYAELVTLFKEGKIKMKDLDEAVSYVLQLKFKLGLFEAKEIKLDDAVAAINQPEGRALALKAAEESMVLLKNNNHILPLQKNQYKKIALIGPCAATGYTGDYSGISVHNVSILEGIKNILRQAQDNKTEVLYAKGCNITANGDTISYNNYQNLGRAILPSKEEDEKLLQEAKTIAQQSDIIIIAIGENEQLVREAGAPDHFGDRSTLDLPANEEALAEAMVATGKPVIVYLTHGRPLSINWIAKNANAVVDGWFTGEESGNAFAKIIFGDVNPSGKLTITVPKSVGQLPMYYDHKPSAQYFEYVTESNKPLYAFGYGLSYTTYTYSPLRLAGNVVSVDITNAGNMKGDEIVQLYIHQKVSSVTRPVKELKDFSRISLEPGEKKTVSFTIDKSKLAFWTKDMKYAVERGVFEIMVGKSSADLQTINFTVQ